MVVIPGFEVGGLSALRAEGTEKCITAQAYRDWFGKRDDDVTPVLVTLPSEMQAQTYLQPHELGLDLPRSAGSLGGS